LAEIRVVAIMKVVEIMVMELIAAPVDETHL
jgi:hypothetical protein